MKTPVLIAAYNEAASIGRTLDRIDGSLFEPIVIANGCDDGTADIARGFGATVIEREEQGKLPALQEGLRHLGHRALDKVLFTDADSYPLSNRHWQRIMLGGVDEHDPAVVSGPIIHIDGEGIISDAVRTVRRQLDARKAHRENVTRCFGANMLTFLHNRSVLDAVVEMPHIWPGEDRAMEEVVVANGGVKRQITDVRASVMFSSRYLPSVVHVLRVGEDQARKEILKDYRRRAAPGSITYGRYQKRKKRRELANT